MIGMTFLSDVFPTPAFPYYGALMRVTGLERESSIERIEVNGVWTRDYAVDNDGKRSGSFRLDAQAESTALYVRTDWVAGSAYEITVSFNSGANESVERVTCVHTASGDGGYWDKSFKYYGAVVVTNDTREPRVNEPIHQVMSVYDDRVADPEREVRVVHVDEAGEHTEIPSQVYEISRWKGFADKHCQPTCNFDVAFLASVPAYQQGVYLVFYGNEAAQKPVYKTDLNVTGEGFNLRIENKFYAVNLHDISGTIYDVKVKQGVNQTFEHGLETNGSVNWNPDLYAPPVPWNHISDWNPPENYAVEIGPVFCMVKRWGVMPMYEDALCSVTYVFYAGCKPIIIETTIELTKPRDVIALRNGEIVLNRELVREVAWKNIDGSVETSYIDDMPRHPIVAKYLPRNTPWIAMYNREKRAAIGVVYVKDVSIRKDGGLARDDSFFYFNKGPWIYFARPILYTFVSNNPQRVMRAHGSTISYERLAWVPYALNNQDMERAFEPMEEANEQLRSPLNHRLFLDTDERVPTSWIPPILLEEFEEME